ncbi:PH domain-containing protein [Staphylococcus massiliensis]|uniref:YdbS-like PH domain-containing protein n=1 Tax=Staphylococcus massiliensis S46 TaxID=1229783 RepID=K9AIH2_9STAP|nr:PH domain-containing protein [Staphylococcus massiliensis]EKU47133.1 hypothetical protein C273_07832 [Staphylococcus massiliensis S46]MCG3400140.1 PH domain-containing protein [Staphylococcus massiliensis]MCG3413370.1 PH domain-containing protein [Staphylococcus massiliensis]PNZ98309.1 hypothetical protein CD133_08940 [Staphylococcus massiliensis CCUG 55927]
MYSGKMDRNGIKVMRVTSVIQTLLMLIVFGGLLSLHIFLAPFFSTLVIVLISVAIALYFIVTFFINPKFQYHVNLYEVNPRTILSRKGFIEIKEAEIPTFRIQNVHINEGFIMRKYDVAHITLSTAGGNTQLIYLNKKEAKRIQNTIKGYINDTKDETDGNES